MSETTLTIPDTKDLEGRYLTLQEQANALVVLDPEACRAALALEATVAEAEKAAHAQLDPPRDATNKAHKLVTALCNSVFDPLAALRKAIKTKVRQYEDSVKRKQQEGGRGGAAQGGDRRGGARRQDGGRHAAAGAGEACAHRAGGVRSDNQQDAVP